VYTFLMEHTLHFSRPSAHYRPGTVRYFRWEDADTDMDIRCYRPPEGWSASVEMLEYDSITGEELPDAEWWITETKDDRT